MADTLPIPTAFTLSAVPVYPAANSLRFSQDGQAILLTKYAVHLLTPELGVSVGTPSAIKQTIDQSSLFRAAPPPVSWLRTVLEFDRALSHQWPAESTEWGAVSLGSLDPSLTAVAPSPSNLTAGAGWVRPLICVLALLNSNLELTIWGASKNLLTGEWTKLHDVTSVLQAHAAKSPSSAFEQTLRAQSTCVDWSSQPIWNGQPARFEDASLLAVGNRGGSVTFLRYDMRRKLMTVAEEVVVSDMWITHLAWSAWTLREDNTCEAMLACALSDGSVVIISVSQSLASRALGSGTESSPDHGFVLTVGINFEKPSEGNGSAITGLRWADVVGRKPILMHHIAGILHLWSPKRSVGSSALCSASGIAYIQRYDLCVIALSDGSFHSVHQLSVEPTLDPHPTEESASSGALSAASRSVFARVEQEPVTFKDVDFIHGMTGYDGAATFMWAYEASRPTNFSYKYDAKHVSTFILSPLWNDDSDDRVLRELAEVVAHARCAHGEAPISALRPILLHLRDANRIARLHSKILGVLTQNAAEQPPEIQVPGGSTWNDVSREVRESLTAHMFGWDAVHAQRLRYSVATFCEVRDSAQTPPTLPGIRFETLQLIRSFACSGGRKRRTAMAPLSAHDVSFAVRVCHHATKSLGGSPAVAKEAEELLTRLPPPTALGTNPRRTGATFDVGPSDAFGSEGTTEDNDSLGDGERCPACNAAVPLEKEDSAVCTNGHVWDSNVEAATATDGFQADLRAGEAVPLPRRDRDAARDAAGDAPGTVTAALERGFMAELLEATTRCPVCANAFVVLV
ncbi:transcription factor IIIC subunit delta N-term-domain-containing protein [Epithele typhae]|uniref:transcription factor IIIC subunit delta N-term-domain-containing protein n=1 Tax=Epithele typhae TaxID=378194 RepID=UPI002007B4C3|nr:transcription factor IIIC subunit delta N-term-domain-containing protein [Epithele typhae]KAH9940878.1 transcription factor IIIC subunit delta N-term-domain-containing protein [Epithele typhae]